MRILARLVAAAFLLAAVAGGVVLWLGYEEAHRPFRGYSEPEVFFTVAPGEASAGIARRLAAAGIVRDARLFLAALRLRRATGRLQAGEYRFAEPLSTAEVIDRLVRGDVYTRSVTIPEGLTLEETAASLERAGLGEAEAFERAFRRGELVAPFDPAAEDLEGYLFPDTYRFGRRPDPTLVAATLVERFETVFDETRRRRAAELGLGVREVVTLASIVEKETGRPEERAVIASVFWNRLRRGMPLQSDPTIIFALKRRGLYDGNLKRSHLELDSPYNTYRRAGLPPGPIASPGLEAIDAVLRPAETRYLYFVSRNDGSHHFSESLREHAAAVRKYQVEYFRSRRRRARDARR